MDCGHPHCEMRTNGYHSHLDPPATCPLCPCPQVVLDALETITAIRLHAELTASDDMLTTAARRVASDPVLAMLDPIDQRRAIALRTIIAVIFKHDFAPEPQVDERRQRWWQRHMV